MLEGLKPFNVLGKGAIDLYEILPNNGMLFVAINQEKRSERGNSFLLNLFSRAVSSRCVE